MNNKLMIAFAALALVAVGCESNSETSRPGAEIRGVGGGPAAVDDKASLDEKTKSGEIDRPSGASSADPVNGPESLAGGGSKTANGATGKSIIEPSAAPDAGAK
jgi:hypothetical protein